MKFFTSDLHFNHAKIIDFCPNRVFQLGMSEELYSEYLAIKRIFEADKLKCPLIRNTFMSVREKLIKNHNECVVKVINKYVKKRDPLYIIGDFGFGSTIELKKWFNKLNGQKILIWGNHDRSAKVMLEMGFHEVFENHQIKIGTEKTKITLSHFPYFPNLYLRLRHWLLWRKNPDKRYLHKRVVDVGGILLHGHTHGEYVTEKYNLRQIHVGIDAWGKPVSEKEILKLIEKAKK